MDPQQRLALQVAYEAVESAGYYGIRANSTRQETETETDVECYLRVGSVDYEDNVASADANAFSATGTLRAFISGRISHFFGWSGPSITFDTACSSSAVAIHTGCKALLAGECAMALAGGVNVITSPALHQNLAAASFLNPSGSSRAFDASAAGYCRGEGAGIIVLKPLSKAIAAGDKILSVISGSAVNQGSASSSITVPDSHQQSALYRRVLSLGRIDPMDVGYVEAHGTGMQDGDLIEYDSVRLALTGAGRKSNVFLGSVKDNIGHAGAASGAAGLIKTILMMHHKTIPRQANFTTLNPKIKPSAQIEVPQQTQAWTPSHPGSNAAIALRAYPTTPGTQRQDIDALATAYPIVVAAKCASSLQMYLEKLTRFISASHGISLRAFHILSCAARTLASSTEHHSLHEILPTSRSTFKIRIQAPSRALQTRLSCWYLAGRQGVQSPCRESYMTAAHSLATTWCVSIFLFSSSLASQLTRSFQDKCEAVCQYLGLPGILNHIFAGEPVDDIVLLHCMLLAIQVSCALFWLDAGLKVDTLIGHSFGQLAALCVADSISLEDAFRLVAGRARRIRDKWGPERGVMLMVECEMIQLKEILTRVNFESRVVLAGDASSVDRLQQECSSFKTLRLQNTHAYHSYLADGILDELRVLAASVTIRPPRIHVETCSPGAGWTAFTPDEIIQHTRQPVYFQDAVERTAARLSSAVWLEAGSAHSHRWHGSPHSGSIKQRAACLSPDGVGEDESSVCVDLPPYQFEETRHWVDYKPSLDSPPPEPSSLVSLLNTMDADGGACLFRLDTLNPIFDLATRGHAVVGQSLYPASMYIELAVQSAVLLSKGPDTAQSYPNIAGLTISSPLGLEPDLYLRLEVVRPGSWDFTIFSKSLLGQKEHGTAPAASACLILKIAQPSSLTRIVDSPDGTSVSGSIVFQLFQEVVNYAPYYRGVRSVSALGNEAVGLVNVPGDFPTFLDKDTICHPVDVFMCTTVDEVILAPCFPGPQAGRRQWTVYTHYEAISSARLTNNIFVYDAAKTLVAVIVGAAFRSVPFKSLARTLTRLNQAAANGVDADEEDIRPQPDSGYQSPLVIEQGVNGYTPVHSPVDTTLQKLRGRLAGTIEIPLDEVQPSFTIENLGIDSLLVSEVLWEIQKLFDIRITRPRSNNVSIPPPPVILTNGLVESLPTSTSTPTPTPTPDGTTPAESDINLAVLSHKCFSEAKPCYDSHAEATGFAGFYAQVSPIQSQLVVRYVVDAMGSLGCNLEAMVLGDDVPTIPHIESQRNLVPQLYKILEDARLITRTKDGDSRMQRSETPLPTTPAASLHATLLDRFPSHASKTKLLHTTGHNLANCLSGAADPLSLIFRDASTRGLLEDVYTNAPMFKTGTLLLAQHLGSIVSRVETGQEIHILELGAGTGGTPRA
ncbi:hypothetical protein BDW59DRAFT_162050 [Aspergillus cavernicola]|uniref:Carrier domain-containing protein n=1 Tax=Aspergillus cavernicola TaxID=176166 RepID=A0ABR4IAV3_9EURO